MKVGFIGQGYGISSESVNKVFDGHELEEEEITTVGQAIVASLADSSFHTAHFLTAFVTRSGVQQVADANEAVDGIEDLRFYVGVDQEATTEQGLDELLKTGIETKVFQLRRSELTYHPKVFLFKGDEEARVITGSANVTKPGLLENTEAVTVCDADLSTESDRAFVADVEKSLLNPVDGDATSLTESLLEDLAAEGQIGDEDNRNYSTSTEQGDEKRESRIDLGATPGAAPPTLPSMSRSSLGGTESHQATDSSTSDSLPSREDLPPIPEYAPEELPTKTDRKFYKRLLKDPTTQPGLMRRIIFQEGEITQGELKQRLIDNHGYDNSGSLDASLRVLWRTTGEIKKTGRGSNARLTWVDEDDRNK